jgi:hypothetical protein
MTPPAPFLTCRTVTDFAQLKAEHGVAKRHYTLQATPSMAINTEERFWAAVIASLPLDPPIMLKHTRYYWDALDDSLFGGLLGLGIPAVDIIWPFANDVAVVFLVKAVKFFKNVAENVHEHNGMQVRLCLVCSNEASRQRIDAEFWFLT